MAKAERVHAQRFQKLLDSLEDLINLSGRP